MRGVAGVAASEGQGDQRAVRVPDDVRPVEADVPEQLGAHGGIVVDAERATIERDGAAVAQHRVVGQDVDQRRVPADERAGVHQGDLLALPGHLVVDGDVAELDVVHHVPSSTRQVLQRFQRSSVTGFLPENETATQRRTSPEDFRPSVTAEID